MINLWMKLSLCQNQRKKLGGKKNWKCLKNHKKKFKKILAEWGASKL